MFNDKLFVIKPNINTSPMINSMVKSFCYNFDHVEMISNTNAHTISELNTNSKSNIITFKNKKILFVVELDSCGYDLSFFSFISEISKDNEKIFDGSVASLIIRSSTEFYTKRVAQDIIFICNNLGCTFIGHPLVEATCTLSNFTTWQKNFKYSTSGNCFKYVL